ncbi:MAG: hypothetical protein KGL35_01290 [Bradyrhizobium sp.]|nr:hypothetical protein [Bradyrhizobium sp.]
MSTPVLEDFISWAGTARRAAALIGVDETRLSKIRRGRAKRWAHEALAIERATSGRFRAADLLGLSEGA